MLLVFALAAFGLGIPVTCAGLAALDDPNEEKENSLYVLYAGLGLLVLGVVAVLALLSIAAVQW